MVNESTIKQLWVEKYRPSTLSEYIFQNDTDKKIFSTMVSEQSIPHLLLAGVQGTGKTALAFILINELEITDEDVLIINASDENSVDVIRDKIKGFASTFPWGNFKICLLEEADYITPNGQAVLRRIMEEYSDTVRFILTCNYDHRIIPALKSRCQQHHFSAPNKHDITEFLANILLQEQIKFKLDVLDFYISVNYPDIRKILNTLQQHSINGKLILQQTDSNVDYKFQLLPLLERGDFKEIRKLVTSNVDGDEWENVYRFLYENLYHCKPFDEQKWEEAIVIIADHLVPDMQVSDREINFAACVIRLGNLI